MKWLAETRGEKQRKGGVRVGFLFWLMAGLLCELIGTVEVSEMGDF